MTNEQILKKAIEKAVKNGWEGWKEFYPAFPKKVEQHKIDKFIYVQKERIIFSYDFAKAFWGKKRKMMDKIRFYEWEYQLQTMVLEKDPIKYLKQFI